MAIDRAAGPHQGVDVGHRHQQARAAGGQRLGHAQLVQVARVVVVDGKPGQVAQVADGAVALRAGLARVLGLLQGLRRKGGQQAPGAHGFDGDLVEVDGVHGMPVVELAQCTRWLRLWACDAAFREGCKACGTL